MGGLISAIFLLGFRAYEKWFKKTKIGTVNSGEDPEGKGRFKTMRKASNYKRYLEKSLPEKGNNMGMVFCRGCGEKIHETAPTCPHCGAPQGLQTNPGTSRSNIVLVFVGLGWTLVFWFGFLIIGGMI